MQIRKSPEFLLLYRRMFNSRAFVSEDMRMSRVVAITGCDSGLGWAMAARSAREGLITVAGMLQGTDTKAAAELRKLSAHPYSLDVTDPKSVTRFRNYVDSLLNANPDYNLHAVVNNAGIMTIGNFEWQTPSMIENTINVNLLGAMRVATAFLPSLRKSAAENTSALKPRIINVASHCGLRPLPGFGVYSASKAGLLAWTKALRYEHRNQGLSVVAFVPGGFINSSNIIARQFANGEEIIENLSSEQKTVYQKQITTLTRYLGSAVPTEVRYDSMKDENIMETFVTALVVDDPAELYKVESLRYKFYYNLLKLPFPERAQNWLIKKFVNFPLVE